ncbi:MAG: two-component regulator propeller domain-containing protein, partial [Bacteroidota bacterium]
MLFFEAFINKIRPVNYLFLLLLSPTWLTAQQETKFEIVNQRNGLTSNSVSCILQDSTGFLWIGTGDGLNKYNGVSITPIRFSRTNNVISSISNSYDNFIWVGTIGGGLISYNTLLNEADTYIHEPANATSLSDNNISFTHQDRHGYVWVATDNGGLDKLDPAK